MHKGAKFLRKLEQVDAEKRLEFHFLGNGVGEFPDLGVNHGPYEGGKFKDRVREIEPSSIGIFDLVGDLLPYPHGGLSGRDSRAGIPRSKQRTWVPRAKRRL